MKILSYRTTIDIMWQKAIYSFLIAITRQLEFKLTLLLHILKALLEDFQNVPNINGQQRLKRKSAI